MEHRAPFELQTSRPGGHLRHILAASGVALCLLCGARADAVDLSRAVLVGGAPIPPAQVERALVDCSRQAPQLKPDVCLDTYFSPRWLLDREAQTRNLAQAPAMAHRAADLLHRHLVSELYMEGGEPNVTEIDKYLKDHRRDFEKPLRIRIFRILVATQEEAESLIKKLKPNTKVEEFRALAREQSLDRATNERGGDLGFVWPDGSTDVPQVSAEPSLYSAALSLKDGQFSASPIPEGERFAVLWRRGSLPAQPLSAESREVARLRIIERRGEAQVATLLSQLFKKHVTERDDVLLGKLRRKESSLFEEH